jgi:hypothetical protein
MRWSAQVRHIVAKDVRRNAIALIGYVVAIGTAVSVALRANASPRDLMFAQYFGIIAAFLGAAIVQDDSPSQEGAPWRSLPIAPSAMCGAKIGLVAAIALGTAFAESLAPSPSYGRPQAAWSMSAFVLSILYGVASISPILILAALTKDLIGFALAYGAYALVRGALTAFGAMIVGQAMMGWSWYLAIAFPLGASLLLYLATALLYTRRDEARTRWIVLAALIVGAMVSRFLSILPGFGI